MKPRFLRLSYFLWIIVPLALYGSYHLYGLPHVIWSYRWIDHGQGHDPFAFRHYTECTFVGPYGAFTVYPGDGSCGWLRFYHDPAGGL